MVHATNTAIDTKLDTDVGALHAAVDARDNRFDGVFFVGITSTGIYCRCICPARTAKRANRRFFASAAAAENDGFRPCLMCRPECAPGLAPVDAAARLAHSAVKRIEAGALDERNLTALASELGVTDRHLRRVVLKTFGAAPVDIAQTHRLLTAKRLLKETQLPMTEVALASGFRSLRRFNALFLQRYELSPSRIRGARAAAKPAGLTFTLAPRGAFDGSAPLKHFQLRRITGLEAQTGSHSWARTLAVTGGKGVVHRGWLTLELSGPAPRLTVSEGLMPAFRQVIASVRGAFDLDADVDVIDAFFAGDVTFKKDVKSDPRVRLPGHVDAFELAVRAVLGQQVTVKAATTLGARLVERFGDSIETGIEGVNKLFPTPKQIVDAGVDALAALGQPGQRAATLHRVATEVLEGRLTLKRGAIAVGREGLSRIAGIGPWTLEYIALRGLGDPDAFPFGDSYLRSAFGGERALKDTLESWRPWRGYAAARLWRRDLEKHTINERKAS